MSIWRLFLLLFVASFAVEPFALAQCDGDMGDMGDGGDPGGPGTASDDGTTAGIADAILGLPSSEAIMAEAAMQVNLVAMMLADNEEAMLQGKPAVWGETVILAHAMDAAAALQSLGNLAIQSGIALPNEPSTDLALDTLVAFEDDTPVPVAGLSDAFVDPTIGTLIHDAQLPVSGVPTVRPFAVVLLHRGTTAGWAVKNVGTAPATLSALWADYPGWIQSTSCPVGGTLAPGQTCIVHVLVGSACGSFTVDLNATGPLGTSRSGHPVLAQDLACGS